MTSSTATPTQTAGDCGQLLVERVHADAAGNDHDNLNGEYIVFESSGETSLDISGWTISDETDQVYQVPDGLSIAPGAELTLYPGSGTNTDTELYWGSGSAIWNPSGDTMYVRDHSSVPRKKHSYG